MILNKKRILITGSAGSVGQELINSLCTDYGENVKIIGIDKNENAIFRQKNEHRNRENVDLYVCDVNDKSSLKSHIFCADIVIHCAAMKHVILAEDSPQEAVSNNITGVQTLIEVAQSAEHLEKVLFTSSDKAVNPTNVMGTTKLLGERLFSIADRQSQDTIFSSTRFGNVIGSNGSVLEVFKSQLDNDQPLTLTDPEMTRFIMSKKEAAKLVLDSLALMQGGEVYITKMPVIKIVNLAHAMIEIYKERAIISKDHDYPIKIIGPKPGEKMYEELMTEEEANRSYETNDFFVVRPIYYRDNFTLNEKLNFKAKHLTKIYNSKLETSFTTQEVKSYLLEKKLV